LKQYPISGAEAYLPTPTQQKTEGIRKQEQPRPIKEEPPCFIFENRFFRTRKSNCFPQHGY
jgi:hypothetical protein